MASLTGTVAAAPPIVMPEGPGSERLNGLMLLLAIENLKRRPSADDAPQDREITVERLMGIAEILPAAGEEPQWRDRQ